MAKGKGRSIKKRVVRKDDACSSAAPTNDSTHTGVHGQAKSLDELLVEAYSASSQLSQEKLNNLWEAWFSENRAKLYSLAFHICGSNLEAEEVVEDVIFILGRRINGQYPHADGTLGQVGEFKLKHPSSLRGYASLLVRQHANKRRKIRTKIISLDDENNFPSGEEWEDTRFTSIEVAIEQLDLARSLREKAAELYDKLQVFVKGEQQRRVLGPI